MLSTPEVRRLLKTVKFPGEERFARNQKIAESSKSSRRTVLRHGDEGDQRIAAAVEIQRVWRGFWLRCRLAAILQSTPLQGALNLPYGCQPPTNSRVRNHTPEEIPGSNGINITSHEMEGKLSLTTSVPVKISKRKHLHQRYLYEAVEHGGSEVISYEEFCAHIIQNWWSKLKSSKVVDHQLSKRVPPSRVKSVSIVLPTEVVPQVAKLKHISLKKKRDGPLEEGQAATMIQKAWRKYIDVQVYGYYRDLINFRCCGNPAMMLRCINPKESQILDAAAGVHIKFRLAGDKFPPNIYYKIFTHRTIVDMCANSPKDYTALAVKRRDAKVVHNKGNFGTESDTGRKAGWYQRVENNGWRLVSDRLILKADQDPITLESSKKKQEFHHSKLIRKADVERKKRRRKLEWMQKMYQEGMVEARSKGSDTDSLIEGATAGMLAMMDKKGNDAVEDWEVDELLHWTDGLNFDDYLINWQEIATSAGSEMTLDNSLTFNTTLPDPFEFSFSVAHAEMDPTLSHPGTGKRAPLPTPMNPDAVSYYM